MANESPANEGAAAARIRREITSDQICVLTFDRPDSSANVFDQPTLEELGAHLDFIEGQTTLRGVVLTSAKDAIFIAGADLNALARTEDEGVLSRLIALGQDTFNRIARLQMPTVAAIHGACVGGGYEVCLACDMRLATPDKATKIGLPETQLGILPAWGGTTRLPALIGLPAALDIILGGKTVPAQKAFKIGMIDGLAPREHLLETAWKLIVDGKRVPPGSRRPSPKRLWLLNNRLSARLAERQARPAIMKRTRGHYPAVIKALDVAIESVRGSERRSFENEANAIMELAQSDTAKRLIEIFFLQERSRKLAVLRGNDAPERKVSRTAVIGAGVMGSGIAQWLSSRGLPVTLRDISVDAVARGMANVEKLNGQAVQRHKMTAVEARQARDRIFPTTEAVRMTATDLVIEAAVEKMELKEDLFHQLEDLTSRDTILATNTSALSVTKLAADLLVPERVVGIHFFNPVHRMQLVEVVRGEKTDDAVLHHAVRFVQRIGKLPVVVKDSPGFIVNRILMPYLIEAALLFEQGAEVKDVDEAMLEFGMPMGPLRLIDEVGVDIAHHVSETLAGPFSGYVVVPKVLDKMLERGWLGRKSGRGFYLHEGKRTLPNHEDERFMRDDQAANHPLGQLQSRMGLLMINEAARCLEEEIVEGPRDIDFAMIMGTGFAPFRGGPLRFADSMGIERVVSEMNILAGAGERQFRPCDLLVSMARTNKRFYNP